MPGLDKERLYNIQKEIIMKGEVGLSNQFASMLLYHLTKNRMMLKETMDLIEEWIPRHKVLTYLIFRVNTLHDKFLAAFME